MLLENQKAISLPTEMVDDYSAVNNHYMQTPVWANVKRRSGWRVKEVHIDHADYGKMKLFLYIKSVKGIGNFAYAPMWPNVFDSETLSALTEQLKEVAHSCFAVRFEPAAPEQDFAFDQLIEAGYVRPGSHVQYLSTLQADLTLPKEDIFASFNATARYEVRTAGKRYNVVCNKVPISDGSLNLLATVLADTQKRKKFYMRKDEFLEDYWQLYQLTGQGNMYIARSGYDVLAMAYVIVNGKKAFYKDGGAIINPLTRKSGAPTVLQWYIMQDLQDKGVESYDLCGALAGGVESETDPLWGVYRFKRKFTNNLIKYPGFIDLPINDAKYQRWRQSERLITKATRTLKRDIWY